MVYSYTEKKRIHEILVNVHKFWMCHISLSIQLDSFQEVLSSKILKEQYGLKLLPFRPFPIQSYKR